MSKIASMNQLFSALLFFSLSQAMAKPIVNEGKLLNFQPGTYALIAGSDRACGSGDFMVSEDESALDLGIHVFPLAAKLEAEPCLDSKVPNCIEHSKIEIEIQGDSTILTKTYTTKHSLKPVQTNVSKATIRKEIIMMQVTEKGLNNDQYTCKWKFKTKLP